MSAYLVGGAIGSGVAALGICASSFAACVIADLAEDFCEAVRRARQRARQGKPGGLTYGEARARYYAA